MKRKSEKQSALLWALFEAVYHDVVGGLLTDSERRCDLATARSRLEKEGLSFLTKRLPQFGKSIDKSLSTGCELSIRGFQLRKDSLVPLFLGGLVSHLFTSTGRASADDTPGHCSDAAVRSLKAIRQLSYLFYKLELPFEDKLIKEFLQGFLKTDNELPSDPSSFTRLDFERFCALNVARALIHRVLCNVDPLSGCPKHGPGAVATGESPTQKHEFKRYYAALAAVFPYDEWFYYNASHIAEDLQGLQSLELLQAGTAKVVLVPKDSRGPRLISCEPLEYQWIQQALLQVLVEHLEGTSSPTRGYVNFTDQRINQRLALLGSVTGEIATLDMKDASDRVSCALVETLFPSNWVRALLACRSPHTRLPDGTVLEMKKFAPMGSAVCFPVEALCFWALAVGSLITRDVLAKNREGAHLMRMECNHTSADFIKLVEDRNDRHAILFDGRSFVVNVSVVLPQYGVHVYGDDLICRTDDHGSVVSALEAVALRVNADKCCTHGFFRESCGVDAFYGVDVTPARLRVVPNDHSFDPGSFPRFVGFANELWKKGLFGASYVLESWIRHKYPMFKLPIVSDDNPSVLALIRPGHRPSPGPRGASRFNRKLHQAELQGMRSVSTLSKVETEGYALLLREHCRDDNITSPRTRLPTGTYPMAHRNKLKCAWTPRR